MRAWRCDVCVAESVNSTQTIFYEIVDSTNEMLIQVAPCPTSLMSDVVSHTFITACVIAALLCISASRYSRLANFLHPYDDT